jgi:hypothetical protein
MSNTLHGLDVTLRFPDGAIWVGTISQSKRAASATFPGDGRRAELIKFLTPEEITFVEGCVLAGQKIQFDSPVHPNALLHHPGHL